MPIHDWTQVAAGIFHDFHQAWTVRLRLLLNLRVLPLGYYVLIEPAASDLSPYFLAHSERDDENADLGAPSGAFSVDRSPPKVQLTVRSARQSWLALKNVLVVRHQSDDRTVALIELLSPERKNGRRSFTRFVERMTSELGRGTHLLLIDILMSTPRGAEGLAQALWDDLGEAPISGLRLEETTIVSVAADVPVRAYIEIVSAGRTLPPMPLFLTPDHYVTVPLEETYQEAFASMPPHIQTRLQETLLPR